MALRFHIENETNLPDGGPVSFTVTGKRSSISAAIVTSTGRCRIRRG